MVAQYKLCHHFNLALSRLLLSESKPISPLTASLQVLDEQPRIFLAPPSIMASFFLIISVWTDLVVFEAVSLRLVTGGEE